VPDGAALLELLRGGSAANGDGIARPDLILLDLNMPRMDGHTALRAIKADPDRCMIPVVVRTSSNMRSDVVASYNSGAASYVCKPVTFDGLVDLFRTLHHWWGDLAELPDE
jgi:two-component system response regulator